MHATLTAHTQTQTQKRNLNLNRPARAVDMDEFIYEYILHLKTSIKCQRNSCATTTATTTESHERK